MGQIVQIQVGEYRSVYFYDLNNVGCVRGDHVVLEVDRGSEFGRIVSDIDHECKAKADKVKGRVLRKATEGDMKQIENNRMKAKEALGICLRKINERKLEMRIVKAEYTFDSSKIIFSFIAEGRVDFRNLVKDLARVFRVRIELKQIGVRDKAKIIGGYGV
jgi:cell fate regulator YaaT (PSP1 superfamily)